MKKKTKRVLISKGEIYKSYQVREGVALKLEMCEKYRGVKNETFKIERKLRIRYKTRNAEKSARDSY